MANPTPEEEKKMLDDIDKVASNPKYNKNWRVTAHGVRKENGEHEFVSFFPDIVKMVAKEYGVTNSAEIMKHTKVKAYGKSQLKNVLDKHIQPVKIKQRDGTEKLEEIATYATSNNGLQESRMVSLEDQIKMTEKEKARQKRGLKPRNHLMEGAVFPERRIGANQYAKGEARLFDFGEIYIEQDQPFEILPIKNQIADGMQELSKIPNDLNFQKTSFDVTLQEKLRLEAEKQKQNCNSTLNHKNFSEFSDMRDFSSNLENENNQSLEEGEIDDTDYKTRFVYTHEWIHAASKQEGSSFGLYMGGINLRKANFLHEGMTEWLARKVAIANKQFYYPNEERPMFVAYDEFVNYAEIMDTLFPGAVADVYFGGYKQIAKHNSKNVTLTAKGENIFGKDQTGKTVPFGIEALVDLFVPLQKNQQLESPKRPLSINNPTPEERKKFDEQIVEYEKKRQEFKTKRTKELKNIAENFFVIKHCAEEMLVNGEISNNQFGKVVENLNGCWAKLGALNYFEPSFSFSNDEMPQEKQMFGPILLKYGSKKQDILSGKEKFYEAVGCVHFMDFLTGKAKQTSKGFEIDGMQIPNGAVNQVFDQQHGVIEMPTLGDFDCVSTNSEDEISIKKSAVFPPKEFGNQILDSHKTIETQKVFDDLDLWQEKTVFVLKDGTVAFCSNLGALEMNGISTDGAVKVVRAKPQFDEKTKLYGPSLSVFAVQFEKGDQTSFQSCFGGAEKLVPTQKVSAEQFRAVNNLARVKDVKLSDVFWTFDNEMEDESVFEEIATDSDGFVVSSQELNPATSKAEALRLAGFDSPNQATALEQKTTQKKQKPDELGLK